MNRLEKANLIGFMVMSLAAGIFAQACGTGGKQGAKPEAPVEKPPVSSKEKPRYQFCPVGHGWGPDFNDKVISILKNPACNPKDRATAATVAGDSYMVESVKPLLEILKKEEEPTVTMSVISALGRFRTKKTLIPFMNLLDNKEAKIRSCAAEGLALLANRGDLVAIDILKKMLDSNDEELKTIALIGLGSSGKYIAVDGLIELLKKSNSGIKHKAIEALRIIASRKAVPHLIELLNDKDNDIRVQASAALGNIGDSRATPHLIKLLDDKEPYLIAQAARALGLIGDEEAIEPLVEALKKADQNDRWSYAEALRLFGPTVFKKAAELANSDKKGIRQFGIQILGALNDKRAIPILIKALDDKSEDVRRIAAMRLAAGGRAAIEALVKRYNKEKSVDVRIEIINALGVTSDSKTVPVIIQALKEDTTRVRTEAVRALGYIDTKESINALLEATKDESEWVRESAAYSLGYLKVKRATDQLIKLLEDEDAYVRKAAITALGQIGEERAIEPIAKLLTDKNEHIRTTVVDALGRIGGDRALTIIISALNDGKESVRQAAINAIGHVLTHKETNNVVDGLVALSKGLADKNFYVRQSAAAQLSRVKLPYTPEVIEALENAMDEADDYLTDEVFWALSQSGAQGVTEKIMQKFKEAAHGVNTPIEQAVANSANHETIKQLIQILKGNDLYLKASAAIALSMTTYENCEHMLLPLLSAKEPILKIAASTGLTLCGSEKSIKFLIRLLRDPDEDVVISSCKAIGQIGRRTSTTEAIKPLTELLESENRNIALAASMALGYTGAKDAVEPIMKKFVKVARNLKSAGCGIGCEYASTIGSALSLIGGKEVSEQLLPLLKDPNPRVRREALAVATQIKFYGGEDVEDVILTRIKEENDLVIRDGLITLAGLIKSKKSVPFLKKLIREGDNYTKSKVIETLGRIADPSLGSYIMKFLKDPVMNIRRSAIKALGKMKYEKSVKILVKMLNEERYSNFHQEIISSLYSMGRKQKVIDALCERIKETKNKDELVLASFVIASLGYDGIRPTIEKRLKKFGAPMVVMEIIHYLLGDETIGNSLYQKLKNITIPRKASESSFLILQGFYLKGEKGRKYLKKLVHKSISPTISNRAKNMMTFGLY